MSVIVCTPSTPERVIFYQGPSGQPGKDANVFVSLPISTPLSGHRAIRVLTSGEAAYASSDDFDSVSSYAGISSGAATSGEVTVQVAGSIEEPSWSFTPGGMVYIGASGVLTQSPPSGTQRVVGVAFSATKIIISPQIGIVTI